jgi:DNA-binding Lrp family transcriptional regulator
MDAVDRKIVNVLQIRPRAPWGLVGSVVGVDPTTAARRWERLHDAGAVWISCHPFTRTAGEGFFAELTCDPGTAADVAVTLAGDPNVASVNVKAGGHDVLAEVGTASTRDSARYRLGRLAAVPGIRSVRTLPVAKMYWEGSQWRLRALDREEEAMLAATAPQPPQPPPPFSDDDWEVLHRLAEDPRISQSELGKRLGVSPSTARRRLLAVADGRIRLRCELARGLSGWPVYGTFFADCPAARIDATARALARIPEVRAIVSLIGPFNLYIALWLRSAEHIQDFESQLNARAPYVSVVDRSIVLRPVKQVGQLLDEDGWRIGNVPFDFRSVP